METKRYKKGDEIGKYSVIAYVGKGTFGCVYKVQHTLLKNNFAMKIPVEESGYSSFLKECKKIATLDCDNIIRCYDFDTKSDSGKEIPYGVFEWMGGGDLESIIVDESLYKANAQSKIIKIAADMARGLHHAHSKKMVHRDIKPANVLLNINNVAKIADFGLASALLKNSFASYGATNSQRGTLAYAPPEQGSIESKDAKSSIDVFSWALTLLSMYHGPVQRNGEMVYYQWGLGATMAIKEISSKWLDYSGKVQIPSNIKTLIQKCLDVHLENRPSFNEILKELDASGSSQTSATVLEVPNIIIPKAEPPPLQEQYRYVILPDGSNGIEFGSYPQGAKGEVEPIQWRILGKDKDGAALLLSDKILDRVKYHRSDTDVQWKDSDIRAWLNGEGEFKGKSFIETAFSDNEQGAIEPYNSNNNGYYDKKGFAYQGTRGKITYRDSKDKITLLSVEEMEKFFGKGEHIKYGKKIVGFHIIQKATHAKETTFACSGSNFAENFRNNTREMPNRKNGLRLRYGGYDSYMYSGGYWLRNSGSYDPLSVCIVENGFVFALGQHADNHNGLRPAVRVRL